MAARGVKGVSSRAELTGDWERMKSGGLRLVGDMG